MFFETDRLYLRPFEPDDAKTVQALTSDKDLARTTLHIPYPYPEGYADHWITSCSEKMKKGSSYSFAIILKGTMELVGCLTLNIALNHNRGELAYWIGKPYWDNGYATEASKKIIDYAFCELDLNRIWASVMDKNQASIEVMKKSGLLYEGKFPQHVLKWGHYEDVAYYGLVKAQYKKIKQQNEAAQV
ncbi:GNAT family N-acetyltransferase [Anaerobacillus isosaccharinicus]|uniref:GNAT family N-acetyltransferase n=1 Tax=Anaerobacillus isosaccharinicus TaxID=1532552 RepID=A0A7S7L7B0_9BACI|nr:GNAT family N-acetyltransferase [Anaerobacillus isosaccharinicus]MBA5586013.1 GNAT family N-acetyltransferase [Anaerobacillus isosaccharinicus]QOY35710.1 GNAT family N-acetyltransferase [Anaerobacillus isosaccharinicus]